MIDASSVTLPALIEVALDERAADLYVKAGSRPMMKQFNEVVPLPGDWPILDHANAERMIKEMMDPRMIKIFDETFDFDLGFTVPGKCRVRMNVYRERGGCATSCRVVPLKIKSIEELGLPPILNEMVKQKQGLILVTGPTGSGKTTSLAAMIDLINKTKRTHIVTIEDPLEFIHPDQQSYVSQREIGLDTIDFKAALRASLRQAPDVILIGEMRDSETMNIALQAGETGHLVFSTLHTASAYETMDRVVNMFPPHEKHYLSQRLSNSLKGVVSQKLLPRKDGNGRVCAMEILICTPTVTKMIEEAQFRDLYNAMNDGNFWGMQTMNQSLLRYVKADVVSEEVALHNAGIASELRQMLRR